MKLKYLFLGLLTIANVISVSARIDDKDKKKPGSRGEDGGGDLGDLMLYSRSQFFGIEDDPTFMDAYEEAIDGMDINELEYYMSFSTPEKYKGVYSGSRKQLIDATKILVK